MNLFALPCPSCGSKLKFSAEKQAVNCSHCGYIYNVDQSNDHIIELDLHDFKPSAHQYVPEDHNQKVMDCDNCGSKTIIPDKKVVIQCSFCGSEKIHEEAFKHQIVKPQGIIPFKIGNLKAEELFKEWIIKGWFRPTKLKKYATPEYLQGVYLPHWTFDAFTDNQWSGEAGTHYNDTERKYEDGEWKTVTVRKTRWTSRHGSFTRFFDDILIIGTTHEHNKHLKKVLDFNLDTLINFTPEVLAGWKAEVATVDLMPAYSIAEDQMKKAIRKQAKKELGGDEQRHLRVSTDTSNQTFKHILLPIWTCAYEFNGKKFNFVVNGQTGEVSGKKPVSPIKIVLFIVFIIAIIATIIFFVNS